MKILALLDQFHRGRQLEMIQFQSLLGMISAAVAVVPLGFLRALWLQRWLNALKLYPRWGRHVKHQMARTRLQALGPWRDRALLLQGGPLGNIPLRSTDAALTGRGAV